MKVLVKKLIVFKNQNLCSFHILHTLPHCTLFWGTLIQSTSAYTIHIICYLRLGIRCFFFLEFFFRLKFCRSLSSLSFALYLPHPSHPPCSNHVTSNKQYRLWSLSLCSFTLVTLTYSFLRPDFCLSTLLSKSFTVWLLCFSLRANWVKNWSNNVIFWSFGRDVYEYSVES